MIADVAGRLSAAVADLEEAQALALVRACLAAGDDPADVIAACEAGMRLVGRRYEQREYFLSGLIMAGEIFRGVLDLAGPALQVALAGHASGKVLLGTVQGDIHDIGKSILQIALRTYGFTVEDLGVDVPPDLFVERARSWQPDVIGLSGLITIAYDSMKETVARLRAAAPAGSRHIPVIIGGGLMDERVCRYVGADHWSSDALAGVRLIQRLVSTPE